MARKHSGKRSSGFSGLSIDLSLIPGAIQFLRRKLQRLAEFEIPFKNNCDFIPNFGERWRQGERISTAFR